MTDDLAERLAAVLAQYAGPQHASLRTLIAELVADGQHLRDELARRDALIASLTTRLGQLESALSGLQRAGRRQAAPFSKRLPKANPKTSGRKPGEDYGPKAHRAVPARPPGRDLRADLPEACPHCGGAVQADGEASQTIEDIVVTTVITKVVVAKGRCRCCRRRIQGRHPEQVSGALGAASSQLGPCVQGLIAILAKDCGLSHGKVARVLHRLRDLDGPQRLPRPLGEPRGVAGYRCRELLDEGVQDRRLVRRRGIGPAWRRRTRPAPAGRRRGPRPGWRPCLLQPAETPVRERSAG
jgi:hypothetical protein